MNMISIKTNTGINSAPVEEDGKIKFKGDKVEITFEPGIITYKLTGLDKSFTYKLGDDTHTYTVTKNRFEVIETRDDSKYIFRYRLTKPNELKMFLTVNSRPTQMKYPFLLTLPEGFETVENSSGVNIVYEGKVVCTYPNQVGDSRTGKKIHVKYTIEDNKIYMNYDENEINSLTEKDYPLIIDPTIIFATAYFYWGWSKVLKRIPASNVGYISRDDFIFYLTTSDENFTPKVYLNCCTFSDPDNVVSVLLNDTTYIVLSGNICMDACVNLSPGSDKYIDIFVAMGTTSGPLGYALYFDVRERTFNWYGSDIQLNATGLTNSCSIVYDNNQGCSIASILFAESIGGGNFRVTGKRYSCGLLELSPLGESPYGYTLDGATIITPSYGGLANIVSGIEGNSGNMFACWSSKFNGDLKYNVCRDGVWGTVQSLGAKSMSYGVPGMAVCNGNKIVWAYQRGGEIHYAVYNFDDGSLRTVHVSLSVFGNMTGYGISFDGVGRLYIATEDACLYRTTRNVFDDKTTSDMFERVDEKLLTGSQMCPIMDNQVNFDNKILYGICSTGEHHGQFWYNFTISYYFALQDNNSSTYKEGIWSDMKSITDFKNATVKEFTLRYDHTYIQLVDLVLPVRSIIKLIDVQIYHPTFKLSWYVDYFYDNRIHVVIFKDGIELSEHMSLSDFVFKITAVVL